MCASRFGVASKKVGKRDCADPKTGWNRLEDISNEEYTLLALVPLTALGLSQAAQGAISLTVGPAGSEVTLDEMQGTVVDLGNGAVSWVGDFEAADGSWKVDWALVLNPDPAVAGVLAGQSHLISLGEDSQ